MAAGSGTVPRQGLPYGSGGPILCLHSVTLGSSGRSVETESGELGQCAGVGLIELNGTYAVLSLKDTPRDLTIPHFLQGGGETGALLRQMDWASHPLGLPQSWPAILKATISIILGSRQPMFLVWGAARSTLYNDGYAVLCGKRHPAALGAPLSAIWHDIWDAVGPMVRRVYAGEAIHMDDIELLMHRNGYPEETHFSFSYNPLRGESGEVQGLFCVCAETTEQVRLRRELDHERTLLGQMFEQAPSFIAKLNGADHRFEFVNPAYLRLVGQRDIIGLPVLAALPELRGQGYTQMLDSVLATGEAIRADGSKLLLQQVKDGPLEERFVDFVYQPLRNTEGAVTGIFVEGVDVTGRIQAASALRESEQFLRSVLALSPDCIKVLDLEGRIELFSDGGRVVMEVPDGQQMTGRSWPDLWQDMGRQQVLNSLALAGQGESSAFQAYSNTFAGNRRYWDVRVTPMLGGDGRPERILAFSRDITHLKRMEEEREFLMGELSHRLKNVFTIIQSVIQQTLRRANSLSEAGQSLSGRIQALAGAQNILTKSPAGNMDIQEVVEAALLAHRTGEGRFDISGPAAIINASQGLGLSLALHELATNATKYGSLSRAGGQVAVNWEVERGGGFVFNWDEKGGPPVSAPERGGFGSMLIETVVASYFNGSAKLQYLPAGVAYQLTGTIASQDNLLASGQL
jgi:PAS domain S-box-containing protein